MSKPKYRVTVYTPLFVAQAFAANLVNRVLYFEFKEEGRPDFRAFVFTDYNGEPTLSAQIIKWTRALEQVHPDARCQLCGPLEE